MIRPGSLIGDADLLCLLGNPGSEGLRVAALDLQG
jgi:hypothetical protein